MHNNDTGEKEPLSDEEFNQAIRYLLREKTHFSAVAGVQAEAEEATDRPSKLPYTGQIHVNSPDFVSTMLFIEKKRRQAKKKKK